MLFSTQRARWGSDAMDAAAGIPNDPVSMLGAGIVLGSVVGVLLGRYWATSRFSRLMTDLDRQVIEWIKRFADEQGEHIRNLEAAYEQIADAQAKIQTVKSGLRSPDDVLRILGMIRQASETRLSAERESDERFAASLRREETLVQ